MLLFIGPSLNTAQPLSLTGFSSVSVLRSRTAVCGGNNAAGLDSSQRMKPVGGSSTVWGSELRRHQTEKKSRCGNNQSQCCSCRPSISNATTVSNVATAQNYRKVHLQPEAELRQTRGCVLFLSKFFFIKLRQVKRKWDAWAGSHELVLRCSFSPLWPQLPVQGWRTDQKNPWHRALSAGSDITGKEVYQTVYCANEQLSRKHVNNNKTNQSVEILDM